MKWHGFGFLWCSKGKKITALKLKVIVVIYFFKRHTSLLSVRSLQFKGKNQYLFDNCLSIENRNRFVKCVL